jgi:uncharacterized protein DUF4380
MTFCIVDKLPIRPDTGQPYFSSMTANPTAIKHETVGDWDITQFGNNLIRLGVVPAIGGRVVEFSLGGKNAFYVNPRHRGHLPVSSEASITSWQNYGGSKVWPAPQGWSSPHEWPGPPDPVLDAGSYQANPLSQAGVIGVRLQSPHDEYSGVTLEREIEIRPGSSLVRLHHVMRNTSQRPVRWSIWQVTQVEAGQGLEIFVPADEYKQTLGDLPYEQVSFDAAAGRLRLQYHNQVAKLAVNASQGWFAALDRSRKLVFVEQFPINRSAEYPDGAPVAFWIAGQGTFTIHGDRIGMSDSFNGCDPHVETEVMGPLTRLSPGESTELSVRWALASIDAQEIVSVNDCGAAGRALVVTRGSLAGSFGVFFAANLQLVAFNRAAQIVAAVDLGPVSPLHPVVLREKLNLPSGAVRCMLQLLNENGSRLGILDHVQIR